MEGEGQSATAFDRWLHKQLHELYDSIAREPLPGDLVDLIECSAVSQDRVTDKAADSANA
jgi:hypothetical protein